MIDQQGHLLADGCVVATFSLLLTQRLIKQGFQATLRDHYVRWNDVCG